MKESVCSKNIGFRLEQHVEGNGKPCSCQKVSQYGVTALAESFEVLLTHLGIVLGVK